jgi:hypothetical protein
MPSNPIPQPWRSFFVDIDQSPDAIAEERQTH